MTNDERINRINAASFTELPTDMIRAGGTVQLMVGAAPDGLLTVGLLFRAPAPIGAVEFMLNSTQVKDLHDQLHDFVSLNKDELSALRARVHGDQPTEGEER